MFAEVIDQSGNVILRNESEIKDESDLTKLVGSVNERFCNEYPQRSLLDNLTKARCTIRIGTAENIAAQSISPQVGHHANVRGIR
jgi:hypothetical protein